MVTSDVPEGLALFIYCDHGSGASPREKPAGQILKEQKFHLRQPDKLMQLFKSL